jgi:hypothetical protein
VFGAEETCDPIGKAIKRFAEMYWFILCQGKNVGRG